MTSKANKKNMLLIIL